MSEVGQGVEHLRGDVVVVGGAGEVDPLGVGLRACRKVVTEAVAALLKV
jgi:hypothetical protein